LRVQGFIPIAIGIAFKEFKSSKVQCCAFKDFKSSRDRGFEGSMVPAFQNQQSATRNQNQVTSNQHFVPIAIGIAKCPET
jgi:hypothetical protein